MRSLLTMMLTMLVLSAGPVAGQSRPAAALAEDSDYGPPVTGVLTVLTPFAPPATRYGSGHLGVDVAAPEGAPVLAAGAGRVRFVGSVAGRGVVVILHPDGISTEYEPVAATVHAGEQVTNGERIGRVNGAHKSCAPSSCLHWGARRGVDYLDPMTLLRPLGVVRLLPWAG